MFHPALPALTVMWMCVVSLTILAVFEGAVDLKFGSVVMAASITAWVVTVTPMSSLGPLLIVFLIMMGVAPILAVFAVTRRAG